MCAPKSSTRQEQCVGVANQLPARPQTSGMTSPQQSLAFSGHQGKMVEVGVRLSQPGRQTLLIFLQPCNKERGEASEGFSLKLKTTENRVGFAAYIRRSSMVRFTQQRDYVQHCGTIHFKTCTKADLCVESMGNSNSQNIRNSKRQCKFCLIHIYK